MQQQLPWSEPANQNAIHGLTRWMNWQPVRVSGDTISMRLLLHAQPGYPFAISLQHDYTLSDTGLTVTHTARNVGATAVPYGVGMHPYFTVGTSVVDSCVLSLPAARYFVTNSRSIPTGPAVPVAGTAFDFRKPRAVGGTVFDTGFADLLRDRNGVARIGLQAPSGRAITLWLDAAHQYVQIYSGDTLPDVNRRRRSLAIEPYTCAADAFNNGFGVRTIKPGDVFQATWGVSPQVR